MRFPKMLSALPLHLAMPACAATISLSGTVITDAVTHDGLAGVKVSLAKEGSSTTAAVDGSWAIPPGGTTGLSGRDPMTATLRAMHLSIRGGHIVLRYGSRDILGHALSGAHSSPSGQHRAEASPAVLARSTDASGMLDTLLFSWKGAVRVRVPIASYQQSGIVTVLDTSSVSRDYGIPWNDSITYGMVTDFRDGHAYRSVKIGSQRWMAENLNYRNTTGSSDTVGVCHSNSVDSCSKYGRLYTWSEVMALSSHFNDTTWGGSDMKHQGICPTGWHVPSNAEWTTLTGYLGTFTAGNQLKSTSGWKSLADGSSGNGSDAYGFRGLPAGYRYSGGSFTSVSSGRWWSATEFADADEAWNRYIDHSNLDVVYGEDKKAGGYSLRCIENADSSGISTALDGMLLTSGGALPMGIPTSETGRCSDQGRPAHGST